MNNRIKLGAAMAAVVVVMGVQSAHAHGPQMQITRNTTTGKIETRTIVDTPTAPTSYGPLTRVFVVPGMDHGGQIFAQPETSKNTVTGLANFYSGSGLSYQYNSVLAGAGWEYSGSSTLPNLTGTTFTLRYTAGLKKWNGSSFVDAGSTELQAFLGAFTAPTATATTTDTGPFNSLAIAVEATQSANPHTTVRQRFLGDGTSPTSSLNDGIYLVGYELSSNAPGVNTSDPFYYVINRNSSEVDAMLAASSLGFSAGQIQAIPEPASLGLLGISALGLLARRRRGHATQA